MKSSTIAIIAGIVTALLCFLIVFMLVKPFLFPGFNLSTSSTANIGSTIGGITAPIIGILTTILLIITLQKQIESNKEQSETNNIGFFFLLFNEFQKEIAAFHTTYIKTNLDTNEKKEYRLTGLEGLYNFANRARVERFSEIINPSTLKQKSFFETGQILLFLRSFQKIMELVNTSKLSVENKSIFRNKLFDIYKFQLRWPIETIVKEFNKNERMKDETTMEMELFISQMKRHISDSLDSSETLT